ncbi:glycosyltransferase [Flagellimonas profundi]|uniref:Glycosyltransferase family 4 protein n=1 Tax=Flagellimonas profundi TaxID=2915620 RepID=A0ABS3FCT2_9FLAO|nr:glycosyltransferase [Allomuricauda profundi]MBO0340956.1 glycosyltransferase family 4 protein [Allomuricauda profundi]
MSKKLLVIGYVWPEPTTTAAGCRMQQLLEALLTFGYQITFASTASKTKYSLDLEKMGITEAAIQLNHSSFDDFVKELSPHLVLFDRFMVEEQFGWRVAEFAPQAIRILNTEDLHALRKAREENHKKGKPFEIDDWKNHPMTLRETASMYRCDLSLMISTYEMEILQQELHIPSELLLHLPFMVDVSATSKDQFVPFEARKGFVSIGNGKHAPNIDAVKVLKQEIWPRVRKQLPNAEIHIYGAYLPQQVNEMHHPKSGFYIEGWAKNVNTVLENARAVLAPLQFGAGIKGKLLDAMRAGTPSVTTKIGAEGMHGDLPWNGTIADDWDEFAQAAVELHQGQELWEKAQKQGIELLRTFYDKQILQDQLKEQVQQLSKSLETHRQQNFIGRLLQHQTMSSTKYMAKWIEKKNRG